MTSFNACAILVKFVLIMINLFLIASQDDFYDPFVVEEVMVD